MPIHTICARYLPILVLTLLSVSLFANASQNSEQSVNSDQLVQLKSWLAPPDGEPQKTDRLPSYAVQQQVILYIEVSTPRWFTGGTRIAGIDITDVAVKQRNQLATNFTEKRSGVTWTHQRWEITLYPLRPGRVAIPATAVTVQVSQVDGTNVKLELLTEPQQFMAVTPAPLANSNVNVNAPWVAGREFSAKQRWSASAETLAAGDSITRTVTVTGLDTLAMLIPPLINSSSSAAYQRYAEPHQFTDSQTRGEYISSREESVVYVLQQGGEVDFTPIIVRWWDTDSQQLQEIELPGNTFTVAHTLSSWLRQYAAVLVIIIIAILVLAGGGMLLGHYYKTRPLPLRWRYAKAVRAQDWPRVRVLLYRVLRQQHQALQLKQAGVLATKQRRAGWDWQQNASLFQTPAISKTLAQRLWRHIARRYDWANLNATLRRPVFPQLDLPRCRYTQLRDAELRRASQGSASQKRTDQDGQD